MNKPVSQEGQTPDISGRGCLVRLGWMFVGNGLLLILALAISSKKGVFLSGVDLLFWATVAALAWLRRFDIRRLGGQTALGTAATAVTWRKYLVLLLALSLLVWAVAHVVALARV